jgi:prepilin-type N-terminal cleavage/methylation domain-containing protein
MSALVIAPRATTNMPRPLPLGRRRAFTLLELLVVLVLLGLSAAVVVPSFRLPAATAPESALLRARALAVRRGESVRLATDRDGRWLVVATADTEGTILLAGDGGAASASGAAGSVVISALGLCQPEGHSAAGTPAWDPMRCAVSPP